MSLLGGLGGWWCLKRQQRTGVVAAVTLSGVVFVGILAGWGSAAVERYKAPRILGEVFHAEKQEGDVCLAAYEYFQPSLVFYCRRQIVQWVAEYQILDVLNYPYRSMFSCPRRLGADGTVHCRPPPRIGPSARSHRGFDVVLVTNR